MVDAVFETGGIGQPVLRKEDLRLLRGQGRYTDDIRLDGQAYAAMLRSPHAHARVAGIDTAAAKAVPGAIDALTAADLAADGVGTIPSYSQIAGLVDLVLENADGSPRRGTKLPVLAGERVRFVGDIVAAAIGETPAAAADAAERIAVDYEPLDAVTETGAAPAPGAPSLWDEIPGNTCIDGFFGDPDATESAFAAAAHVVSLKTRVQRVTGVMMEPRAAVARYDADADRFILYCGGDNPVRVKRDIAAVFGVEEDRVRVVAGDVGGNFGTRNWTYPEYAVTLWAARRLGRPVKWTASRSESFLSDYQGRDLEIDAALALDAEGNFPRSALVADRQCRRLHGELRADHQVVGTGADRLRFPRRPHTRAGGDVEHRLHRALSQRRAARGDAGDGATGRSRRAGARLRPSRAAPAQPDLPIRDALHHRARAHL